MSIKILKDLSVSPILQIGHSGSHGEVRYPKHIDSPQGFPRVLFLERSSSPFTPHYWDPSNVNVYCVWL